jgi:hypothetical protein
VSLAEIQKEAANSIEKNLTTTMYGPIDRINYSNLERNWLRRQSMERCLQNHQQQPRLMTTPYKRINATDGEMGECVPKKAVK